MPARQVCQNFFPRCVSTVSQIPTKCFAGCHHRSHQWRITDADQHRALFTRPGSGQNKIKRVDRLLGNESLHRDIPLIFRNIIAMLTSQLSIVTDAGFQSAWCWHIRSLGWDFICRVREISRCSWTAKVSAGSGVRNYRPEANQNIWGRVLLPVRNMPV